MAGKLEEMLGLDSGSKGSASGVDAEFVGDKCVSVSPAKPLYGFTLKAPFIRGGQLQHDDMAIEFYDVECEGNKTRLTVITGSRKVWLVEIEGTNLLDLMHSFREHKVNFVRALVGNSAKFHDAAPIGLNKAESVITLLTLTDVTKQYREG